MHYYPIFNLAFNFLYCFPQFEVCPQHVCRSTPGIRTDLFRRDIKKVPITDFFGSVRNVELSSTTISISNTTEGTEGDQQAGKEKGGRTEHPKHFGFVEQFPVIEEKNEKVIYPITK